MPFRPLPARFAADLADVAARGGRCLDLGCGDGALSSLLTAAGVRPWGLDLRPSPDGAVSVVGDARRPPVRQGSLDLVVAGNLLRHLAPRDRRWTFLGRWASLLNPAGALYVLEDAPQARPAGCRNHRDLQAFLARLLPESRGPLLPAEELLRRCLPGCGWRLSDRGRQAVSGEQDAGAALAMLRGDGGTPAPEVARLVRSLQENGLAVGSYWWARLVREETG